MISTVLKDSVPRTASYPANATMLSQGLEGAVPLDEVVVYFLHDSAPERRQYDPTMGEGDNYPVLVVRHGIPHIPAAKKAALISDDPTICSILVFPVKLRVKEAVAQLIESTGMRAIRNWFAAASNGSNNPKRLVLWFNETLSQLSPRFADDPNQSKNSHLGA